MLVVVDHVVAVVPLLSQEEALYHRAPTVSASQMAEIAVDVMPLACVSAAETHQLSQMLFPGEVA